MRSRSRRLPVADAGQLLAVRALVRERRARATCSTRFHSRSSPTTARTVRASILASRPAGQKPSSPPPTRATEMQAQVVSGNYFAVLGVNAALGRHVSRRRRTGAGRRAGCLFCANWFWRRRMQGDPGVVSSTISANGTAFAVIGVAPATLIGTGNPPQVPDFWAPLMMQGALTPVPLARPAANSPASAAGASLGRRYLDR